MTPAPLSPLQRAALAALAVAPLKKFRVGWAHGRAGPFHSEQTVATLAARGLIRVGFARGGGSRRVARAIEQAPAPAVVASAAGSRR